MVLTIVVLDKEENFLRFLDPDLCTLKETHEYEGLRTLNFQYEFQDMVEDKELFKIGNKLWIQGDANLTDCLYVINTKVTQDIYQKNTFELELEEILVELNYAPLFSQVELNYLVDDVDGTIYKKSSDVPQGHTAHSIFHLVTSNGKREVIIDWNALNYWFGDYFNMGIVQSCISDYASRISITGTVNLMTLLRDIESETGNIFVTRYEKDILDNTIHRYLDFLNPINSNKNWSLHLEYDFNDVENNVACFDKNGNIVVEDTPTDVTRFENTKYDPESISEDDPERQDEDNYDEEIVEVYNPEDNELYDFEISNEYTQLQNLTPSHCDFRITDGENLLNTDGRKYDENDPEQTPLKWECSEVGLDDTDYPNYLITLQKKGNNLGVIVNEKSFAIAGFGEKPIPFSTQIRESNDGTISSDSDKSYNRIPDDSYFEIYDYNSDFTLFRTQLNTEVGHVHEEILDFGFNLENIEFNIDETETYTAVSPILQLNDKSNNNKELSRGDIDKIIDRWVNLSISKGKVYPMIVEKINVEANDINAAKSSLGTYSVHSNYWARPQKPNDNTDNNPKQFEFLRAIAYWKAPYDKKSGEMHVSTTKTQSTEYTEIYTRKDTRSERAGIDSPKMGNIETSNEDIYSIYNQIAEYLKEHEDPDLNLEIDVANLRGHEYNNYELHDKIYIKLPNTKELITSRITKTEKEAHDIAKNKIEISNYKNINTIKTIQHETYIDANGVSFKYPKSKNLKIRLVNGDYDSEDPTSVHYPVNKLISFTLYKVENNSSNFANKVYSKLTDSQGYASINMKYDPGVYELDIYFAGDEEYNESGITITINVEGKKEVTPEKKSDTKAKTTAKTGKNKKTVKVYWTKCGLSPDEKHKEIVSIAQPSSADANKYSYNHLYRTVFKNYCPNCRRKGTLRFDGGKANKCIKSAGAHGRGYKVGVPEHEITCSHCDSDYCGVTGLEKSHGHVSRLKTIQKPTKTTKSEFNKLVKGKLQYGTKTITVTSKKMQNTKTRTVRASGVSNYMKKIAQSIVKNKTGSAAMTVLVNWWAKHIKYARYEGFKRAPDTVLKKRSCNCCDGTRAFFTLCDAAGLSEYYNFYYVHVKCPKFGHVYGIIETKKSKKWRYFDSTIHNTARNGWGRVLGGCPKGSRGTKYPKRPF